MESLGMDVEVLIEAIEIGARSTIEFFVRTEIFVFGKTEQNWLLGKKLFFVGVCSLGKRIIVETIAVDV